MVTAQFYSFRNQSAEGRWGYTRSKLTFHFIILLWLFYCHINATWTWCKNMKNQNTKWILIDWTRAKHKMRCRNNWNENATQHAVRWTGNSTSKKPIEWKLTLTHFWLVLKSSHICLTKVIILLCACFNIWCKIDAFSLFYFRSCRAQCVFVVIRGRYWYATERS